MSARSRAKPWFRDARFESFPFRPWIGAWQALDVEMNASSYDLWQQAPGDPVADMEHAMRKLRDMPQPLSPEEFDDITRSVRRIGRIE